MKRVQPDTNIPPVQIGGIYVAWLSQSGTDDPTAQVLINTIGKIVWTRSAEGQYYGTLNGAFTVDKTTCPPFDRNGYVVIPLYGNGTGPLQYGYTLNPNAPNAISLQTFQADGTLIEFSDIQTTPLLITINVYT